MKRPLFTSLLILLFSITYYSQSKITGKVIDEEFNETMPFANVLIKGTSQGVTTDFDGNYSLEVQPGTYTVVFSFVGYQTKEITGITVKENEVKELSVNLSSSSVGLEEVVISVSVQKNTDEALLMMQKKSANLMDGLSSESFKKVGSSNLAGAIKRAPGVSVMGGKYVYVRGLGDRYTKSILNGIDIPGLDPDRNTIQMDLFPTNIIDNVQIIKSFTADVQADFTGGLVNIVTKEFPAKRSPEISLKIGFNPLMHLNSNYRSYNGSSTDFLGFDDGKRAAPEITRLSQIPNPDIINVLPVDPIPGYNLPTSTEENGKYVTDIVSDFAPELSAIKTKSLFNTSLGYSGGKQIDISDKYTIGFMGALNYQNRTEYYENAENNVYEKFADSSSTFDDTLQKNRIQYGDLGINNVLISTIGGVSLRTEKAKYKLTAMHLQNGESSAAKYYQEIYGAIDDSESGYIDNLQYTQRSISNLLFEGQHSNLNRKLYDKIIWKISPTLATVNDKDFRTTSLFFQEDDLTGDTILKPKNTGRPKRIWRFLNEKHLNSKLDFSKNYKAFSSNAKLKYGIYGSYQKRDFSIRVYEIEIAGFQNNWQSFDANSDSILHPSNIWTNENTNGSFLAPKDIEDPSNIFTSTKTTFSGYLSNEIKLFRVLRVISGLRLEKFDLFYTGENTLGSVLNNDNIISKLDFFPSLNLVYQLNENSNLRTSLTRTTARPSFKEASIAQIADPLSNQTFNGNIDIRPTYIVNYDIRYELFGELSQMVAISGFYKSFVDPIELERFGQSPTDIQPSNLGSAVVYGLEFELRKNLSFISAKLDKLNFNINASLIESRLTFGERELNQRLSSARNNENIGTYRKLQGQAPFLINSGINYSDAEKGIQTGFFYNVQGKTLQIVGPGSIPDVYSMPFHSLNFNVNKTLGKNRKANINIRVNNVLNDIKESRFLSNGVSETDIYHFRLRNPGRTISLGYKLRF